MQKEIKIAWENFSESKFSLIFFPLAFFYQKILQLRVFLYKSGYRRRYTPKIRTICVGNATLGGNGKTPVTLNIVKEFINELPNIAILTRGYGGTFTDKPHLISAADNTNNIGDEAALYQSRLGENVKILISKDRVKGSKFLENLDCDLVVMDDGLQHLKIIPTIALCLVDVTDLDSYLSKNITQRVFPFGGFREHPKISFERSERIVFIKRGFLDDQDRFKIITLAEKFKLIQYSTLELRPNGFKNCLSDDLVPQKEIKSEVITFSSIAKPKGFIQNILDLGIKIKKSYIFEDHHQITEDEFVRLLSHELPVICTAKDLVKIKRWVRPEQRIYYLDQEVIDVSPQKQQLISFLKSKVT